MISGMFAVESQKTLRGVALKRRKRRKKKEKQKK